MRAKSKTEAEKLETLDADIAGHRARMHDTERLFLRDRAAERFAAAIVAGEKYVYAMKADLMASRAYDFADALMAERDARRAKDAD